MEIMERSSPWAPWFKLGLVLTVRSAAITLVVLLSSAALVADDHSVLFDRDVDFSTFKTFALRDGAIDSRRPELNTPMVLKSLTDALRAGLVAKGLRETADAADLAVEYSATSVDWSIGPFGRPSPINTGRGRSRGGPQILQPDFTDVTLVVDLKAGDPRALVWRGVYNDTEKTAAKLIEALPKNVSTLLSRYPPRTK